MPGGKILIGYGYGVYAAVQTTSVVVDPVFKGIIEANRQIATGAVNISWTEQFYCLTVCAIINGLAEEPTIAVTAYSGVGGIAGVVREYKCIVIPAVRLINCGIDIVD